MHDLISSGIGFGDRVFNSAPTAAIESYQNARAAMRGRMQAETDDEIERKIDETIGDEKKRGKKGDDDSDDEKGESAKDRVRRIGACEKEIQRQIDAIANPRPKFVGKSQAEHAADWRQNKARLLTEGFTSESQYCAIQRQVDQCLSESR